MQTLATFKARWVQSGKGMPGDLPLINVSRMYFLSFSTR